MFRPRRSPALLALLIFALAAFAGVLAAGDPCADDDCAPSCGDCLACGQVAHVRSSDTALPVSATQDEARRVEPRPTLRPARAVEHVPLSVV